MKNRGARPFKKFEVTFVLDGLVKFEKEFELDGYRFFSENNKSWAKRIILEEDDFIAQRIAIQGIENAIISIEKFMETPIQPFLIKIHCLDRTLNETMEGILAILSVSRTVFQSDFDELSMDIMLMREDENYKKALLLWTKPPVRTWNELSKIVELVKHRTKIDAIKEGWISENDLDAFSASANNESVSGILNSRHAKNYGDPPKNTMTLERGEEIVQNILKDWKQKISERI